MKRCFWFNGIVSLLLLMQSLLLSNAAVAAPEKPRTFYTADITVKPQEKRISGTVKVRFPRANDPQAYLHVYPNAFRPEANLDSPIWLEMVGQNRTAGEYTVKEVQVQGKRVDFKVSGTVLQVPLAGTLPNSQIEVQISFDCKLPLNQGRFSYNEHSLWLGNWLPILAIKDSSGWRVDPYYPIGDPFYSEAADYQVTLSLPEGYQFASTANEQLVRAALPASIGRQTISQTGKEKQYLLKISNVRDFALVIMDQTYRQTISKVGNTTVNTWWQQGDNPEQVRLMHETAVRSLDYYSKNFGVYPYPEYDVVKTGGRIGGMEYPGLVFVQGTYFAGLDQGGLATVAHETAHQWFYGIVGSDEVNEAWLDEGLTEYAALAFLQQYKQKLAEERIARRSVRAEWSKAYQEKGDSSWQPVEKFPDWQSYSDLVYSRAAMMLWEMRGVWGEPQVNSVLRQYVNAHRFGIATGKDLIQAFSQASGADATAYFEYWLHFDETQMGSAQAWLETLKSK